MKNVIGTLCLMLISSSAFAMHAYGEDNCTAKMINGTTLEIAISNGQPANPHKIVSTDGESSNIETVEFKGAPIGGDEEGSDLVLQTISDNNVASRKTDDGCFEGYERTSTRTAKVASISTKLKKIYGISKGSTVRFVCYTSASAPTGNNCQ